VLLSRPFSRSRDRDRDLDKMNSRSQHWQCLQISHGGRTFLAENYYNTPRALAKNFGARMLTRDLFAVAYIVHGIIEKIKNCSFLNTVYIVNMRRRTPMDKSSVATCWQYVHYTVPNGDSVSTENWGLGCLIREYVTYGLVSR